MPDSKRWRNRALEPLVLFPAVAVVVLAMIWSGVLYLNAVELAAGERVVAVASRELSATYEAQVVRALREIDQTLKVVKYAFESKGRKGALQELKARALLPPDMVFVVSIADAKGDIVASTRPPAMANVADQDYFRNPRRGDTTLVGRPRQGATPEQWRIEFARPLNDEDAAFSGFALVSVDAAYFVSGYDPARLGEHGVMALLGTDGVFRVRRSGERVSAGGQVPYERVVVPREDMESEVQVTTDAWDGVRRFASARELFDFPLAVVVGLSSDEQLAPVHASMRANIWAAMGTSAVLLLALGAIARLSRQLAVSRQRAAAQQAAHAVRVEYLAYHDGLTTLPNRSLFSKLLAQAIGQAHRHNRHLALLFLDLDGFKQINDTLGHGTGDQLLQEVAARLRKCLRESDTVARLGGDEFVVLLQELSEDRYAATVARKILAAVAQPFLLAGQEVGITASIGISAFPQDGVDEQSLKKNADIAMYRAKQEGKNNFQFYSEQMNAHARERLSLEAELRGALEREEFEVHYQPRQRIRGGRITGVEALLRWRHPRLGDVAPALLIPAAEEAGLMVKIGHWVLGAACRQNVKWKEGGMPGLRVAVNLGTRQFFDPGLLDDIARILRDSGMEASLLELEIGEAVLMGDMEKAGAILTGLREMGVHVSVDDFGAAYAALSALRQIPIDVIKIDRAHICDVNSELPQRALTAAIIAMGRALTGKVVAQGVETKEQLDFIRLSACDEFQGFYLGKPLPADGLTALLNTPPNLASVA